MDTSSAPERQQPRKRRRTSPSHSSRTDNHSESGSHYGYNPGFSGTEDWTEAMRLTQSSDAFDAESNSSNLQNPVSNGVAGVLDVSGVRYDCLLSLNQIGTHLAFSLFYSN